jgi:hypothetical protein
LKEYEFMNITLPSKHQWAVIGSHAVVGAGGIVAGVAFFGGLNPAQVQVATQDISRISSDVTDLIGAVSSLAALAMGAYTVLKAGPLASFFRSSAEVAADPAKIAQVQVATLDQKTPVVTITDKLPEVAGVATVNTRGGQALATAVPSSTVQVAK